MSGHFVLSCDCARCCQVGPAEVRWTAGYDVSSARGIARSETLPEERRWTGDGEFDYAPGHEQAELDGTNREYVRVEERAMFIRVVRAGTGLRPWRELSEADREFYRELAREELLADRKRVRGLG